MTFRDLLRDTFHTLAAHKLRTALTMFGITWGIISITLMVAAGEGLRVGQARVAQNFGKDVMIVNAWRTSMQAGGIYRLYDFPNAFAFHNPAASIKTQENLDARISAQFRMTQGLSLVGRARYRETVSNDTRIEYERWEFILGVLWQH